MTTDPSSTGHVNSKIEDKQQIDHKKHQLRMGPAPFASFEDLSDEVRSQRLESPEDKQQYLIRLPGIHEDTTPGGSVPDISDNSSDMRTSGISLIGTSAAVPSSSLNVPQEPSLAGAKLIPCTPRIDISRASSSSHHEDSKDSTPENQAITALGVGFKEEGALELRSSTEELDFQDNTDVPKSMVKSRPTSPLVFVYDTNFDRQRKDSQTSEICLLSISGRTSRLSSIGSQCSDQSRISTTSHLSVMSGQSGASRSTSPHKMLLETSFCGSRPNLSEIAQGITEPKDGEILEKVLLSRKHDPTEAILAEGITIETPKTVPTQSSKTVKKTSKNPISKPARTSLPKNKPISDSSKTQETSREMSSKPTTSTVIPTISVGDTSVPAYVTPEGEKLTPGQVIKSQTGVEYTFIPLKGPLPKDFNKPNSVPVQRRSREPTKTLATGSAHQPASRGKKLSHSQPPPQHHGHHKKEPEYIRIKLKPDYMYNEDGSSKSSSDTITEKPTTLDLSYREKPSTSRTASTFAEINKIQSYSASPSSVPKNIHSSLADQSPAVQSNASPSLSRRSSLFRSRETISPDSSTPTSTHKRKSLFTTKLKEAGESLKDRTRTRSKSREREWSPAMSSNESIDGKMHKQKTSVFSIFKPKKTPTKSKPSSTKSSAENLQYDGITNVEFTFDSFNRPKNKYREQLLEGDSIRIPLHSPSEYENRTIASAIDSAEQTTLTEVEKSKSIEKQESDEKCSVPSTPPERTLKHNTSTSSENVVFSTKLGSNEEIFTTKLPKKPIVFEKETTTLMSEFTASIVTSPPKEKIVEIKREPSEKKKETKKVVESKRDSVEEKKTHQKSKEAAKEPSETKQESKKTESTKARKEPVHERKEVRKEFTEERREIKIESSKDKEKGKKQTPEDEKISPSDNKMSSQRIEIITETVIKTETITETTPTKTEQITITETSNIEIKQSPKRDESDQIPTPSEADNRSSVISTTEKEETSENSENDSEIEFINKKTAGLPVETKREEPDDQERKTLVFQTDSFEDELPYIPTTLPLERSVAVPIVPIKQRSTFEMKTRPIDRPRSTTPINPSTIDDYCGDASLLRKRTAEKLKINLPREDTIEKIQKLKSPRKGTNPKAWQEFAEKGISSHQSTPSSGGSHHAPDSGDEIPPPLPPRSAPKEQIKQWINFEEIPEKHKPPKRIQTIPSRSHIEVPELLSSSSAATSATETVVYNYVNPEDCQCECHEAALKTPVVPSEEIEPLIQDDDSSDDTIKQSSSSSSQRTKR